MNSAPRVTFEHTPESAWQPPRRRFLKQLMGGMAAAAVLPSLESLDAGSAAGALSSAIQDDEGYWALVKDQFALREDLILMNAANLCPSPYPVMEAVFGLTRDVDSDPSFQNRAKFGELRQETRRLLAEYLGADPEEIVITRNTSEGNNVVIGGLALEPGDEVVIWDQNHPTCNVAWDVRARRYGYTVRRVATPREVQSGDDLLRPFLNALTGKTRVLAFSHVSNISGVALPAKALCGHAGDRGVITLVDGAQTFGAEVLDLHDMGCDFFTGSAHKWPMGPKEAGVLYARRERIADIWPLIVGIGWAEGEGDAVPRFEALGQRDDARIAAMGRAIEFHNTIGKHKIEARVRSLAQEVKRQLLKQIPGVMFHTPQEQEVSSGVVVFHPPGVDLDSALARLYGEHNVGCAVMRGDFAGIRLSPHIYNTMEQVERAVSAIAGLL